MAWLLMRMQLPEFSQVYTFSRFIPASFFRGMAIPTTECLGERRDVKGNSRGQFNIAQKGYKIF